MSGELSLKYPTTGLTIKALILGPDSTTRWNGSAMAAVASVSDANWPTGMITLAEQQTSNGTATGIYAGNFPAGIAAAGEYHVLYFLSTAAQPGSAAIGLQDIWWNGTAAVSPAAITLPSAEREAISTALLDLANAVDGKTPRQALQIIAAVLAGKISALAAAPKPSADWTACRIESWSLPTPSEIEPTLPTHETHIYRQDVRHAVFPIGNPVRPGKDDNCSAHPRGDLFNRRSGGPAFSLRS